MCFPETWGGWRRHPPGWTFPGGQEVIGFWDRPQEVIGFGDRPQEVIGFGDLWGPSGTSGDHLGTIWDMDSMKLSISLRNRTFRSARIDPSSLPKHRRTNPMTNHQYKKITYPKRVKKDQKRGKQAWHNKSPIEFCNYPLLIP